MTPNWLLHAGRTLPRELGTTVERGFVFSLGLGAVVFWLGFDSGSYTTQSWTTAAIIVWWVVVVAAAIGVRPRARLGRAQVAVIGILTAFAAFNGLSALWAYGAEGPFQELDRAMLYSGVLLLVSAGCTSMEATRWLDGLALGLVGVAGVGLLSRLFPGSFPDRSILALLPDSHNRLSYPIGYWNALAVVAALACPLLLRVAVAAHSTLAAALAVATVPALILVIYLASSRTGFLATAVGAAGFVALSKRRKEASVALALAGLASTVAIVFTARLHALVDGARDASSQGRQAALALVLLGAAAGVAFAALRPRLGRVRIAASLRQAGIAIAIFAVIAAVVAANPLQRWRDFTQAPAPASSQGYVQNHLLSSNGNYRWQYWQSAVREFESSPVIGRGADSFAAWWSEHGTNSGFIGNAHSLYAETLGELGVIGLGLLLAALGTGIWVGVRGALRDSPGSGSAAAAATAGFIAFTIAAGVDWLWQVPAVAIAAMVLLGVAMSADARVLAPGAPRSRGWPITRILLIGVGTAILIAQIDLFAANSRLVRSEDAAEHGELASAYSAARRAHKLEPWATSPVVQLALIEERRNRLQQADLWVHRAVRLDNHDWRTWLIAARIQTKRAEITDARASIARVRQLNPNSPITAALRRTADATS